MANITGWGRGAWGEGAWNAPIPVVVSGIEQVTNGEFDSDTTGWSTSSNSSASVSDGIVTITANQYHTFSQNLTLDAGRSYTISVLVTAETGSFFVAIHDGSSVTDYANVAVGTTTLTFTANSGTNQLRLYPYSSGTGHVLSVDSISVKGAVETEGTTSVGTVTALPAITVAVTGVVGTTAVGSETVATTQTVAFSVTGVSGTTSVGSETVVPQCVVSASGHQAVGNPDLAGAFHAEWFVPTDSNDPTVKVISYEATTEVFSDGSSLGTISSAGGTLDVAASNYENKLISADKPITLQNTNNESTGVPTSWAGTSFGFFNSRTGFILQMRALYGTAEVKIFKDGSLNATISVGSTSTTTQTYADDSSDPQYTVFSDLPIIVFKTGNADLSTDTRPAFPATTDFLYGIASGSAQAVRVDGYGETATSFTRFDSNGGSNSSTISTTNGSFANGTDFTGPTNRYQTASSSSGFSIADSDGGEKTSFIAEGCFAHEFRLIEAAEFVCFMGAPGTNGRNIQVFNSSGNLVDTVQLATSDTGSDFPTNFQLISNSTTDSNLTGSAKSYDLTAGMRFVSEVPVGAILEDDSADNEENLFGLRNFAGFMTGTSVVAVTGVEGVSSVGDEATIPQGVFTASGVVGTSAVGTATAAPQTVVSLTSVVGTTALGSEATTGLATFSVTGVEGTGQIGDEIAFSNVVVVETGLTGTTGLGSVTALPSITFEASSQVGTTGLGTVTVLPLIEFSVTGVAATTSLGTATALPSITFEAAGFAATGSVGDVLAAGGAKVTETALTGTVNIGDEAVSGDANLSVTGVSATGGIGNTDTGTITFTITVASKSSYDSGSSNAYYINGVERPVLTLVEGKTYRFDQSDSSNGTGGAHPLRLSTTANGTHASGSEYTTGVTTYGTPGSSGAYTEITVASDAPTLYYYCTNHSNMGNTVFTSDSIFNVTGGSTVVPSAATSTSAVGTTTVLTVTPVNVTTVVGTTSLGNESILAINNISITGVEATGALGIINLYGLIANETSVSYTEVTGATTSYTEVTGTTTSYTEVTGATTSYSTISPSQSPEWAA